MGSYTVKPIKPLKLKQKSWSVVKSEREKEKMGSPKMPRLNKEPVCVIDSSSESDNEEDLPDLDDYSDVICISDEESLVKGKSVSSDNKSSDSDDEIVKGIRSRNYSTSTDDDEVTIIRVEIVENDSSMEDADETEQSSPKCKRRKISGSPLPEVLSNLEESLHDSTDLSNESEQVGGRNEPKLSLEFNKDKVDSFINKLKSNVDFRNIVLKSRKLESSEQIISDSKSVRNEPSSSNNRHFMDSLVVDSDENSDVEPPKPKKFRKKNKMRRVVRRSEEALSAGQITSIFPVKKDSHKKCFWQRHKSNLSAVQLDNEIDGLLGAFSQVHINTIEGCWEDEQNTGFMHHGLKFLVDFSNTCRPPQDLIERIVNEGILTCKSEELMIQSYNCLMCLYKKFPDILKIDFKIVQDTLECLNFGQSFCNQNSLLVRKTIYILRLIIMQFEDEMVTKNISEPKVMRQTGGYKALSYDCSFNNVKELVNYVVYCLTNEQTFNNEIPEILPLLQKLLFISIEVSSNTSAAAKAVAMELIKYYIYLPSIDHKKLLVQTMESNLLRYKLVTLVLERQCEFTIPCDEFPTKLQDIFSCFFKASPPTNVSTPPTTPQSDDESVGDSTVSSTGYPAIYVEELLMLLFEVLECYMQCDQDKSPAMLRRRAYMKREDFTYQLSEQEKDNVLRNIEELRGHVLMLTPELTPASEHYISMMLCVVDWQRTLG